MTRILTALALAMLVAGCSTWTRRDYLLAGTLATALTIDYVQTRGIVDRNCESNPVMGNHGQYMTPAVYFPLMAITEAGAAYLAPERWRPLVWGAALGAETDAVSANFAASDTRCK